MAEEEKPVVAFLGPEGSYTHQAALTAFPASSSPVTLQPVTQIEDVFSAVQLKTAHRGVIPFENSSNGSVVFTLDLFADVAGKYPDVLVCGEAYVAVRHCLLGNSKSLKNKTARDGSPENKKEQDLTHIKTVYSHPQAWGQCKSFLSTHLTHADKQDVSSTSRAAELASQDPSGTSAALSSIMAADLFHLDVLAEGINDKLGNTTRFLIIRNKTTPPSPPCSSSLTSAHGRKSNIRDDAIAHAEPTDVLEKAKWKSLVTFTVEHSNPGALASCLMAFSQYGINLTAINTRPSGVRNWNYVFFVEFRGRKGDEDEGGHEERAVNKALVGLEKLGE
ncbi:PheA Prephenate dehydratase [Pyrenophora tritici-repentis]|nr:PheA Prephenate dehydratase [Pyrenophora tritici-repentis]